MDHGHDISRQWQEKQRKNEKYYACIYPYPKGSMRGYNKICTTFVYFFDFPIISQIVHLSNQDISQDFHLATKVYSLMEHQFKIVKYIYDVQLKLEIVMYACKITRKPCDIHNVPLYVENHKTTTMKKFSSCIHIYMKCL